MFLKALWDQSFKIPEPSLTEQNLDDQKGKVGRWFQHVACVYLLKYL